MNVRAISQTTANKSASMFQVLFFVIVQGATSLMLIHAAVTVRFKHYTVVLITPH